jgi:predicted nucleotidyltransferase
MPDPSLEDLALAISRWAAARPLITRVYVFGSRIRGCTWTGEPVRRNSDLDVAIELVEIDSENLASAFFDHAQGLEQELASLERNPIRLVHIRRWRDSCCTREG